MAPKITGVSAASGEPGDSILLTGKGFTPATEVYFLVAPNRQEKGILGFSNDTQLMVEVPLVTGIPAYSGMVLVKREDGQVSQGSPFRFTPRMLVSKYNFENVSGVTLRDDCQWVHSNRSGVDGVNNGEQNIYWVLHQGPDFFPTGFKVDDVLFLTMQLKNSWIIEDIIFQQDLEPIVSRAELQESYKGTNNLRMKVHGWTGAPFLGIVHMVEYSISVLVRGPEGLSYN